MPRSVDKSPFDDSIGDPIVKKPRRGRHPVNAGDWRPLFIGALMEGASVNKAAKVAGIHFTTAFDRRKKDPEFARAWREAANVGTALLEEEAARRAYHGVIKPVFQKGVRVGYVREYSDVLLMFILKKRDPSYRNDGGGVTVNNQQNNLEVNVFADIERNIRLIEQMDAEAAGGVRADGDAQPLDASQSLDAEAQ
jgi:hypothetical protein